MSIKNNIKLYLGDCREVLKGIHGNNSCKNKSLE